MNQNYKKWELTPLCVLLCVSIMNTAMLHALPPPPGFDNKTIEELLPMLDSEDPVTRGHAAVGIDWQLGRERYALTNVQPALVQTIYAKTTLLVTNDKTLDAQLSGISILSRLNSWTNTTVALAYASTNTNLLVRVRAITALIPASKDRHQEIPSVVLDRLEACLAPDSNVETLWQAAWAAGETGSRQFQPLLAVLLKSPNEKVRRYASQAIGKIERASSKSPQSK